MIRSIQSQEQRLTPSSITNASRQNGSRRRTAILCAVASMAFAAATSAQITVNSKTGAVTNGTTGTTVNTVDRRYQQITPTHVPLTNSELDAKTRLDLIRVLTAEQGFAMRPFPHGHKGLTLAANGKMEPAGEEYVAMATSEGLSAKPGDRLVLTDIKIDHSKIVFDLNGGPDPRHRFLRHIQIGMGGDTNPVMQGDNQQPVGARLTLTFQSHVPELTGAEVKALLAPLISFDVKTPVQAFTDTLPTKLKEAILNHHVLVGMSTDMVLFAKGQPDNKSREMEGQMPFEEWIYGKPPKDVEFVRINGNRVIRLEVAKMGEQPVIYSKDEVEGLMRTDGTPLEADATPRASKVGDVERDPNKEAPAAPPSLRKPGETLPTDNDKSNVGVMKPVQFPKQKTEPQPSSQPGANPDGVPDDSTPASTQPAPADASQPAGSQTPTAKPQMLEPALPAPAPAGAEPSN